MTKFGIIKNVKTHQIGGLYSHQKNYRIQKEVSSASIKVEASPIRIFTDQAYQKEGIEVFRYVGL